MQRLVPPPEVYKYDHKGTALDYKDRIGDQQAKIGSTVVRVEYSETEGMLVYRDGLLYPTKGIAYAEALVAVDIAKGLGMAMLRSLSVFDLFHWRRILKEYTNIAHRTIQPYVIEYKYLCPAARGAYCIALSFFEDERVADIVSNILQWDDAWRLMIQDAVTEMKEATISEIKRVLLLAEARGNPSNNYPLISNKIKRIRGLFSLLALIPSVRNKIVTALDYKNLALMSLDDGDRYTALTKTYYNFGGWSYEDRMAEWDEINGRKIEPYHPPSD